MYISDKTWENMHIAEADKTQRMVDSAIAQIKEKHGIQKEA